MKKRRGFVKKKNEKNWKRTELRSRVDPHFRSSVVSFAGHGHSISIFVPLFCSLSLSLLCFSRALTRLASRAPSLSLFFA